MSDTTEVSLSEEVTALEVRQQVLVESLATLELALEDAGWIRLALESANEFTRAGLTNVNKISKIMWLKNPIIKRGVKVQANYVFGQEISISAPDPEVDEFIQRFLSDSKNRVELTSPSAMIVKEEELQIFGNIFFVFFTNKANGRVRVRSIPMDEIMEIIPNPEDGKEPWFYKRAWSQRAADGTGETLREALYPDWHYRPTDKPASYSGVRVEWDTPVYHVRVNRLSDMQFGVSEVYASIDWARAYKEFLEDWATLSRAHSRWAAKLTMKGGASAVAAAKGQLEAAGRPLAGSTFLETPGAVLSTMKIGGANVSAEDGRRMLLMAIAGMGLPETFFGDVSVGTLATARSLDRPTELMMVARQTLWSGILSQIGHFVTVAAVEANQLKGAITEDDDGTPTVVLGIDPETGDERQVTTEVRFPPILEHDVSETIDGIVSAATLNGLPSAGTIPDIKTVSQMLLSALGHPDVDGLILKMFPEDVGWPEDTEPEMIEAVRELREAISVWADSQQN